MDLQELKLDREQGEQKRKQKKAQQLIEKLSKTIGGIHIDPAPDPTKEENDGVATIEDPRSLTRAADAESKKVVDEWVAEQIGQLVKQTPKLADRIRRKCGYRPIKAVIVCQNHGEEYWRKFWFRIEPH
jgi:hypothetical protein